MNKTVRLENWCIVGNSDPYTAPELETKSLSGNVYGHPNFNDGDPVITSPIDWIQDNQVRTLSGSIYELGAPDPEYERAYPGAKEKLLKSKPRTT